MSDKSQREQPPAPPDQPLHAIRLKASCGCILDWWTWCVFTPGPSLKAQPGGPITCPYHGLRVIEAIVSP